jgi:predicted HAD superfamily Cof-like phosphohydrolase
MFVNCFSEELSEFNEAMADYISNPTEETRANMVKEWADAQYTLSGLAYFFEIDGEEAFTRVADNNMTKVGADGKVVKREDGKILKPEGYEKPDMKGL